MPETLVKSDRKNQRGAAIVLFTLVLALVGIPMVGLAIDGSIIFWAKAKLSAAVDAGALASQRLISSNASSSVCNSAGSTDPAVNAGESWFWANFPNKWLGSQIVGGHPSVCRTTTSSSQQQVTVSATATVPLYFMRLAGVSSFNIYAAAQSSRRNANIVLVLDRSGSMSHAAPDGTIPCTVMKTDAANFVNLFSENFDNVALVTYSSSAGVAVDASKVFKTNVNTAIGNINCTGATSMAQALNVAYQKIKTMGSPTDLNAIVLFTDGQPNEVVATYTMRTASDSNSRYGPYYPGTSPDYNTIYNWGASGCNTSQVTGGLTILLATYPNGTVQAPARTGFTGGLFNTTADTSVSDSPAMLTTPGCYFSTYGYDTVRGDVLSIPTTDYYGNKTIGGVNPYYGAGVSAPETFGGQIRPDLQTTGVMAAAINATDYQAQQIHSDSANIVVYTIGLGGAVDLPIDSTLLERVANDNRSPIYDSTLRTGLFVYASNPSQLNQAFSQVAGQILRLTQ